MVRRVGTSTGAIETSPRYRKKQQKRRRLEEAEWAALAGPVEVRSAQPTVEEPDQGVNDQAGR